MDIIIKQKQSNREADLRELSQARESSDPIARKVATRNMEKIMHESKEIRSMREALVREHRQGNMENVKDIHDYIKNKSRYK